MNTAAIILMAAMGIICALLVYGSRWIEIRYYKMHPPDDGTREEKFEEDEDEHS